MTQSDSTILVTGGAGYIGSHTVWALQAAGYKIVILDNLVYGHQDIAERLSGAELVIGDISDRALLDHLFATHSISAVIHFAAYAYVGESVKNPAKYYRNNVTGTLTLLEAMQAAAVDKIVFSSTCSVYGITETVPIVETQSINPINPYAKSKWVVEQMLSDFDAAFGLKSVRFRYFNAAGASPDALLGEDHTPEPHLIPLVLYVALGKRKAISIFGTDYPTPDGTCIRDYTHVSDIADAHVLGLKHLLAGGQSDVFNLGNGNGFSVREVIESAQQVTGRPIEIIEDKRRLGDPPILVGSNQKAKETLGWQPKYTKLADIITHAWHWHQARHANDMP